VTIQFTDAGLPDWERMPDELRGSLMLPVPEAEPLIGRWRLEHDPPARAGYPAHITLLSPFRPASWLGEQGVADLATFFRAVQPATFALTQFGDYPGILTLRVEPAEPLSALSRQLASRFELLPYGRADRVIPPHLTVARHQDPSFLQRLAASLASSLPLEFTPREAWLMERDDSGYWHRTETFPVGPGA
jgi:2'-5' RNA ligase